MDFPALIPSREEKLIISQVFQASRRAVKEGLTSLDAMKSENVADLEPAIIRSWATMLGDSWI